MDSSDESSRFDVLQRSSSARETREELWIQAPIGDRVTEEDLAYRMPKSLSMEQRFNSLNALEILRESIRVLRFNSSGFMTIAAALLCPHQGEFIQIWKRLVLTYLWICLAILACMAVFMLLLVIVMNVGFSLGISSTWVMYAVLGVGVVFSVVFAHTMIICNLATVVSVLEDCCGPGALFRSMFLIKGRTQVGLLIFLGTTIGTAFVEALFEHRVKTLSYGDGSSRIWEGPLLVIMYSFVVLIDAMMSCIFYFTCKSSNSESFDSHSLLEHTASFSALTEQTSGNDSSLSKVIDVAS